MVVLETRYEKVLKKPWRTFDYILLPYGVLRPKQHGEVLYSEEWNYLALAVYYLHTHKQFRFAKVTGPGLDLILFRYRVSAGPLIYRVLSFLREVHYSFPDVSLLRKLLLLNLARATISLERGPHTASTSRAHASLAFITILSALEQADASLPLIIKELLLRYSGGSGTAIGAEYRPTLSLRMPISLVGDRPDCYALATVASIEIHSGRAAGDLHLDRVCREPWLGPGRAEEPDISSIVATLSAQALRAQASTTLITKSLTSRKPQASRRLASISEQLRSPQATTTAAVVSLVVSKRATQVKTFSFTVSYRVEQSG